MKCIIGILMTLSILACTEEKIVNSCYLNPTAKSQGSSEIYFKIISKQNNEYYGKWFNKEGIQEFHSLKYLLKENVYVKVPCREIPKSKSSTK